MPERVEVDMHCELDYSVEELCRINLTLFYRPGCAAPRLNLDLDIVDDQNFFRTLLCSSNFELHNFAVLPF